MPASRAPFVGRQRELTALLAQLDAAGAGHGRLVLVAGEPGIGKTRLLGEFTAAASARGWLALSGRAYEGEGLPPYLPFMEALGGFLAGRSAEELQDLLGPAAAGVALLMPELHERLPGLTPPPALSPEHERYRLFESVCDVLVSLARATESRGLLLTLDDLHWADAPSLLLLRHLARRSTAAPLLVAGTYRREDLGGEHPLLDLLAALRREALGETLELAPLADEAAALLVAQLAGTVPAPRVATAIQRQAEGNPFFLGEVVRQLHAEGADLADPGAASTRIGLPEGVRQVIGRRVARLSAEARAALQAAAALGDGARFAELRETSGLPEEPLLDALDTLLAAGMLREAGEGHQFGHALIRETVYAALSLARRERLHRRAAEAIERLHTANLVPHVAALASHWRLAGPAGDAEKALDFARQAARQAEAVFAWETAATHWQAALDALAMLAEPDAGDRCELLLALARVQYRSGDINRSMQRFWDAALAARQAVDATLLAEAALGYGEMAGDSRTAERQIALLEEALDLLPKEEHLRVRVMGSLAENMRWSQQSGRAELERADALSRDALALARQHGDPTALAFALRQRHWLLTNTPPKGERWAVATELCLLADQIGDRLMALYGERFMVMDALEAGEIASVDAAIDRFAALAEQHHDGFFLPQVHSYRAMRALLDGRFAEARRLAAAGEASLLASAPVGVMTRLRGVLLAVLSRLLGDASMAEEGRDAISTASSALYEEFRELYESALLTLLGRHAEACAAIAELGRRGLPALRRGGAWCFSLTVLADACAELGDRNTSAHVRPMLLPFSGRTAVFMWGHLCVGAVDHYLGLLDVTLEDWDAAEGHFEAALAMNERMRARPFLAHTRREYAAMLLRRGRRGDAARARELLAAAIASYDELGMGYWADKARALLAGRRLAAARTPPAYPDGLSAREVEVLRLIAAGRSTQEIAAALTISPGTVERHVTNLYRKIEARNRAEAGHYAHRHGLIAPTGC